MMILNDASEITNEPQTVFDGSDPDSKVLYRENLLHYSAQINNTVSKCYKDSMDNLI